MKKWAFLLAAGLLLLPFVWVTGGQSSSALVLSEQVNVKDFHASGSAVTGTGSIQAGSATLTMANATDYAVGQGVAIDGAGTGGVPLVTLIVGRSGNVLKLRDLATVSVHEARVSHDDTQAIKDALNYARQNDIKTVYAPEGTYWIQANDSAKNWDGAIIIYEGLTLKGSGRGTVFKVNPSSINANIGYRPMLFQSHTKMLNFSMDGSSQDVHRNALTNCYMTFLRAYQDGQTDMTLDTLWVYDIVGINVESFGLMSSAGSSQITYRNITGWNVEGTAIHEYGDYAKEALVHDVTVDHCTVFDNQKSGISVYGAENVQIAHMQAYGNQEHGVNIEWSDDIHVIDLNAHDNGYGGIGTWGKASFTLFDSHLAHNNTRLGRGEIDLNPGTWDGGASLLRGNAGVVQIYDTTVEPNQDSPELYMRADDSVTVGNALPDQVLLDTPGAMDWKVKTVRTNGSTTENGVLPHIIYARHGASSPVELGALRDFTPSYWMTSVKPYTGGGNSSSGAILATAKRQYAWLGSPLVLKPGRYYLVDIRYKLNSKQPWELLMRNQTNTAPSPNSILLGQSEQNAGLWTNAEAVFSTQGLTENYHLLIQYNGNQTDSIIVDELNVEEIGT